MLIFCTVNSTAARCCYPASRAGSMALSLTVFCVDDFSSVSHTTGTGRRYNFADRRNTAVPRVRILFQYTPEESKSADSSNLLIFQIFQIWTKNSEISQILISVLLVWTVEAKSAYQSRVYSKFRHSRAEFTLNFCMPEPSLL